jgi:hypothetical protein
MIEQLGIGTFGLAAIFFANCRDPAWARWASICGLCAQPFWFYTTWKAQQWGIFGLSFIYTMLWCKGFYAYWIKR